MFTRVLRQRACRSRRQHGHHTDRHHRFPWINRCTHRWLATCSTAMCH